MFFSFGVIARSISAKPVAGPDPRSERSDVREAKAPVRLSGISRNTKFNTSFRFYFFFKSGSK